MTEGNEDSTMLGMEPKVRRLMTAAVAVVTTMALSAGVASAKSTPAPKQLNQATADKIVAVVESTLGTNWQVGSGPFYANDGQVGKYPIDINGDGKPESYKAFDQQHARTRMVMHRAQIRDVPAGGTLNVSVDVLGFSSSSSARAAARGANNTTTTGSFQTAAGKVALATWSYEAGSLASGAPTTWNGNGTDYLPVNNFLVEVVDGKDQASTRTDSVPVMEAVMTAVVKYLKTGAQ
jgi:hypothetical protein